jgi:hypothetical protein
MSGWVKIPETWLEDQDVEELSSDAILFHLSALAHSARHLRNGFVPERALRRLWLVPDPDAVLEALVKAGWWEAAEGGWHVANWRTFILSAEEINHKREVSRESSERYRRHKAGDHSMCDRCSVVKAGDKSRDASVTFPDPIRLRSDPTRRGEEREGHGNAHSPGGSHAAEDGETTTPNVPRRYGQDCDCTPAGKSADGECIACGGQVAA